MAFSLLSLTDIGFQPRPAHAGLLPSHTTPYPAEAGPVTLCVVLVPQRHAKMWLAKPPVVALGDGPSMW